MSSEKKSIFFSLNTNRSSNNDILQISGFRETNSLGNYLGVTLIGKSPKKKDFEYVMNQVKAKLKTWRANHLSLVGRITLAKSVLEVIPIYPMMTSILPKSYVKEI